MPTIKLIGTKKCSCNKTNFNCEHLITINSRYDAKIPGAQTITPPAKQTLERQCVCNGISKKPFKLGWPRIIEKKLMISPNDTEVKHQKDKEDFYLLIFALRLYPFFF